MGLINYIKDTKGEMKHVSWPTQKQTIVYSSLVIAISIVIAAYVGIFDWVFTKIIATFFV